MTFVEKLKKIRNNRYLVWTNAEYEQGFLDAIQQAIEVFRNHSDWVDASERLPVVRIYDDGEPIQYLTILKNGQLKILCIDFDRKWFSLDEIDYLKSYRDYNVIAWQPISRFEYKSGKNEDKK